MSDEYDLVLEHRGIDGWRLAALELFLGCQQVPDLIRGEWAPAILDAWSLIVDQGGEELTVPPLVIGVGDRIGDERHAPIADHHIPPIQDDVLGTSAAGDERRRNAQRGHELVASADERGHAARRAVGVEWQIVVAQ